MRVKRTVVLCSCLDLFKGHNDLVELIGKLLKHLAESSEDGYPELVCRFFQQVNP
jgi:hypothetical protein